MNSKSVYKYQIKDITKSILVFYVVVACVFVLIFLSIGTKLFTISFKMTNSESSEFYVSSLEFASVIFLFVCGLNMFRETFRLSMQNGVSRKCIWTGTTLSFLTVSGAMALIDTVVRMVLQNFTASQYNIRIQGIYDFLYANCSINNSVVQNAFEGFLLNFCLYTAVLALGYFITVGYYRMNKIAKIIVSIGVPGFISFGLPFVVAFFGISYSSDSVTEEIIYLTPVEQTEQTRTSRCSPDF